MSNSHQPDSRLGVRYREVHLTRPALMHALQAHPLGSDFNLPLSRMSTRYQT